MEEFRHVVGMANAQGLAFEILSANEMRARHPFLETHDLHGGLWDPDDGDIDPSQVTQALATAARAAGAEIHRRMPVISVARTAAGEWRIGTAAGAITCEIVVNAAGYRAREVGRMVGLDLPVVSMEHQYLVTAAIPEIAEHGRPLPIVRDPDVSWYLRQERAGLLLGPYEWDCRLAWDGKEPPPEFGRELFADDLDRLEPYIEDAVARVPVFGKAGVTRVVNGPIPYTPDGNPLIGPAYGLTNYYLCCAFSFGIVQAGGAGKAMAEWIAEGEPEWDLWGLDARRYTDYATQAYTCAKARELYQNEYAIALPFEERPAGRPAKTTPCTRRCGRRAPCSARAAAGSAPPGSCLKARRPSSARASVAPTGSGRSGRNAGRCASGSACSTSAASPSSRSAAKVPPHTWTGWSVAGCPRSDAWRLPTCARPRAASCRS